MVDLFYRYLRRETGYVIAVGRNLPFTRILSPGQIKWEGEYEGEGECPNDIARVNFET